MSLSELIRSEIIRVANESARAIGVEVYDVEVPEYPGGILRINLWRGKDAIDASGKRRGVTLDECTTVSKNFEEGILGLAPYDDDYTLEVSSPGINRILRTEEHFAAAIGERAWMSLSEPVAVSEGQPSVHTITGIVRTFSGGLLTIEVTDMPISKTKSSPGKKKTKRSPSTGIERKTHVVTVPLSTVREAAIDFDFNAGE